MSVFKTTSSHTSFTESDMLVMARAKKIADEVNQLRTDLMGVITPLDAVAQNVKEVALLQEFRYSRYNTKLDKIKTLKQRFSKTFK